MRKAIGRVSRTSVALAATIATVAFAWWAVGLIEGEGSTKTGKASATNVPVKVTFSPTEGLSPTQPEAVALVVENTSAGSAAFEINRLTFTVKTSNEAACPASNFTVASAAKLAYWESLRKEAISPPLVKVAGGAAFNLVNGKGQPNSGSGADYQLAIAEAAPSGCESVTVSVKVVAGHA